MFAVILQILQSKTRKKSVVGSAFNLKVAQIRIRSVSVILRKISSVGAELSTKLAQCSYKTLCLNNGLPCSAHTRYSKLTLVLYSDVTIVIF